MEIRPENRLGARPGVLKKDLQGEAVLLDLDSETYYGLNETGARLWTLVTESPSLRQALDRMQEEFEVEPATLECEARDLVGEWLRLGLVTVVRA